MWPGLRRWLTENGGAVGPGTPIASAVDVVDEADRSPSPQSTTKETQMAQPRSDALVLFGATGDLAYKQIFPALQAMVKHGTLSVPVIGVARERRSVESLRERVRDSLEHHGGVDRAAFDKLGGLLRYVAIDYNDPKTFSELKRTLGG